MFFLYLQSYITLYKYVLPHLPSMGLELEDSTKSTCAHFQPFLPFKFNYNIYYILFQSQWMLWVIKGLRAESSDAIDRDKNRS